jgi:tetrapyrrole methylase family protein/MazG family protein
MADSIGERFERLVGIMRSLRGPQGCPWDRDQTHQSLRRFVLEETYEVLDAIDEGNPDSLREELGDYLFEAVFLAQLSTEAGDFNIGDALQVVCDKLVRRHPHVFGPDVIGVKPGPSTTSSHLSSAQVIQQWDVIKARERAAAGKAPKTQTTLSDVPRSLPALLRAYQVSGLAAKTGFDWAETADVVSKIEVAELRQELESGLLGSAERAEDEMGDLLFSIANLSRKLGIEPEGALRRATEKFARRFTGMEQALTATGTPLSRLSLDVMETEWQRQKARESNP